MYVFILDTCNFTLKKNSAIPLSLSTINFTNPVEVFLLIINLYSHIDHFVQLIFFEDKLDEFL